MRGSGFGGGMSSLNPLDRRLTETESWYGRGMKRKYFVCVGNEPPVILQLLILFLCINFLFVCLDVTEHKRF
jgi:hypothetical protein